MLQTKVCPTCKKQKDLSEYYFHRKGDRVVYYSECKDCHNKRCVINSKIRNHELKRCKVCKEVKPLEEYYYNHNTVDLREGTCKSCRKKRMRENYKKSKLKQNNRVNENTRVSLWCGECKNCHRIFFKCTPKHFDMCDECSESNWFVRQFRKLYGMIVYKK